MLWGSGAHRSAVFLFLKSFGNVSLAALGMIIVMLPLFFLAMYEKDGQPLEVIAHHFIQAKFVRPKIRPYQTDNYYDVLFRQYQLEKEVERIVFPEEKQTREIKMPAHLNRKQQREIKAVVERAKKKITGFRRLLNSLSRFKGCSPMEFVV